ncbi:MAG: hypothetical protein M1813_008325 [Trichoglossum hirsutum]|jgi:hypothetical protein|nr:MAG: hypothetical protein M1813_008325 [Trichoglossum hirsutum]
MTPTFTPDSSLEESIARGEFFNLNDVDALRLILGAFPTELERLKNASPASEPGITTSPVSNDGFKLTPSPSQLLFGADYDEVNRTLVGMLALRWVMSDDYDAFTGCQNPSSKLHPESFTELRDLFLQNLQTPADILSLLVATVVNDLGKDPSLAKDFASTTGQSLRGLNHDMVVYEAARAGMVPCIRQLDALHMGEVMLGLQCGSELNAAQLAQAENVPGSLGGLLIMKGHEHAFALKFMELLLDVAGAAGHVDSRCAKQMIEPVFQAFNTTREALLDVIAGQSSLRQGYDKVLIKRGLMLQEKGFRPLAINKPDERALLRLLTMGRTADKAQAEWFASAFDTLPGPTQKQLVNGLSVDGFEDGKAILPYYMPAMISEGLKNARDSPDAKTEALASLMRFLARVLEGTQPEPGKPGVVVERDLLFARDTISSAAFLENPRVLDGLEIPT